MSVNVIQDHHEPEILDLEHVLKFSHFKNICRTSRFYSCAISDL